MRSTMIAQGPLAIAMYADAKAFDNYAGGVMTAKQVPDCILLHYTRVVHQRSTLCDVLCMRPEMHVCVLREN